ncbi:MAG: hypothetical protein HOV92_12390 [Streptomyces sp.]|nr:hypothetical protein [Streptomyces sp.]
MPQAKAAPAPVEEPPSTGAGLQTTLAVFGMTLIGTVVGTALFGPAEKSERAFRLLHWWKRDPEPVSYVEQRAPRAKHR